MFAIVMACLLFALVAAVPLPLPIDSSLDIYPKPIISDIKRDSSANLEERIENMSSQSLISGGPIVVKKSTMLLNKLMHALHKALDNENQGIDLEREAPDTTDVIPLIPDNYPMDLHRRGEDKMTRYWRCYFNAVSCF